MLRYDLKAIVRCKYCDGLEFWGDMHWLDGREMCRNCYWVATEKRPYNYSRGELIDLDRIRIG